MAAPNAQLTQLIARMDQISLKLDGLAMTLRDQKAPAQKKKGPKPKKAHSFYYEDNKVALNNEGHKSIEAFRIAKQRFDALSEAEKLPFEQRAKEYNAKLEAGLIDSTSGTGTEMETEVEAAPAAPAPAAAPKAAAAKGQRRPAAK